MWMIRDYAANVKRAEELLNRSWNMLIGGKMVQAKSGQVMETINPANQNVLAQVPFAQEEDVELAVDAAHRAFQTWHQTPLGKRVELVHKMIGIIRENKEDLALIDALNSGNPYTGMLKDVDIACETLSFLSGAVYDVKGSTIPSTEENWHFTVREPYGVVARIIPYNHPFMFAASKIAAPILTGNTVILKAPDQDPLSVLYFAELIRDLFPPGVVNIISGNGAVTGNRLVQHPLIKRVSLIGSVTTGMKIQEMAAKSAVKHISLELGGKNPMIVFPDADLEKAVDGVITGMNFCMVQGQSCGSTSRLFLHEDIHDRFVEQLLARMKNQIRLGIPIDPETNMGCLVSRAQYDKVMQYIALGKEQGAQLMCGGKHPEHPDLKDGFFVEPTVFSQVNMDMRIAREEIFGPVLSVFSWKDEDDVLRQANDTEYGLTGSIWTRDVQKAVRFSKAVKAGVIWVNQTARHYTGMPFGGQKNSGLDSEESIEELYSFTQIKTVNVIVN